MHVSIADDKEAARLWLEVAELQLAYGEHRDAALVSLDKALGASPGRAPRRLLIFFWDLDTAWTGLTGGAEHVSRCRGGRLRRKQRV